ncbi:MAG: alanine dehydrogenase [Bacillota bacterium]|nr:alanine dehydrogenase [Bacillota bacterium]
MIIGVPKERKNNENRVSATPGGVFELVHHGHKVYVEKSAGLGSGITDSEYEKAGAKILDTADEVFNIADVIYKVKEPIEQEYKLLKKGQTLFTYLHLAPDPEQTKALLDREITGIAYETVQLADRSLPLLAPMSEVAGRMSIQIGANFLQKNNGGSGTLLGGVPGVAPGEVAIFGGGNVGFNAAKMAVGMGAHVTILDVNRARLSMLDEIFNGRVTTLVSNLYNGTEASAKADLLVGAVLIPGAKAPKVVTEDMVKGMKPGSVIVDVAIDQGGCVATTDHITTHDHPCFEKYGVLHYSVANMPGAVARTSTFALASVTLPYLVKICDLGAEEAMRRDPSLKAGLNTYKGQVTFKGVADAYGVPYVSADSVLAK